MANPKQEGLVDRRGILRLVGASGLAAGLWRPPFAFASEVSPKAREASAGDPGSKSAAAAPWYSQELVRGHISWLHPVWTRPEKDFDARKWIDQFERAGFKSFVFYSKFHDGVCMWPSKLQPIKPLRDFVGEITGEAQRRNIKVVIYYSGGPDDTVADQHPEWRAVRRDGSLVPIPTPAWKFGYPCLNSPYRDYLLGQIKELLAGYNVDGFWLDVLEFPSGGCYCRYCREKYSSRTGGGSLFEIGETLTQKQWQADCVNEVLLGVKEITKKYSPTKTVTYNGSGHLRADFERAGYQALDREVDYFTVEGWAVAPHQVGLICRLVRSLGKPYEINCQISGQSIGWTARWTERLLLEAAAVTAHGGTYAACLDPTAAGQIFDYQIDQLAEVSSYLEKRREWLIGTKPVYDAAVFYPTYLAGPPEKPKSNPFARMATGWPDLLVERKISASYLYPDNSDFSPFQLLILDKSFPISDELVSRVAAFVKRGGNILAELDADQVASPAGQRLLLDVLGVRLLGQTGYPAHFLGSLDKSIAEGIPSMPTLVVGSAYLVQPTTAVPLAYYVYPIAPWSLDRMTFGPFNPPSKEVSDQPAITLNRYGNGLAMYVACPLGTKEIREHQNEMSEPEASGRGVHEFALQLGENLVLRLIGEPLLRSEAPTGLEIVVNEQPGRHVVHLLNNLLHPMVYAENQSGRLTLADVSFSVNEKRIGPVRRVITIDGTELPTQRDGKWVKVTVPRLTVHEVLAFVH